MGREIRRVPLEWQHPKKMYPDHRNGRMREDYQPLYDRDYPTACAEWKKGFAEWESSERQAHLQEYGEDIEFWDWDGMPPDQEYYHPAWTETERSGYAVYETVSEGTPVTPTFATKEGLIDYLVKNGDYWDQSRGVGGWNRANAEAFVEREWAPSGVFNVATGEFKTAREGA